MLVLISLQSSYLAMVGEAVCPEFLDDSFLLSQFGTTKSKARASYIRFVQDGLDYKPWDMLIPRMALNMLALHRI